MAHIMDAVGNIIVVIGLIFMALGVLGIFRFKDYYSRVLVAAKIDTVGFITVLIGLILKYSTVYFSLKIALVLVFFVITNPIATHAITRSAYLTGYKIKKERSSDV